MREFCCRVPGKALLRLSVGLLHLDVTMRVMQLLLCVLVPPGLTQQFYVQPTQCIDVFCVDLRTNSDYCNIQHQLTGFYNRDGVCLLRGTDWVFKYDQVILSLQYRSQRAVLPVTCHAAGQTARCMPAVSAMRASRTGVMRNAYGIMMRKPFGRLSIDEVGG